MALFREINGPSDLPPEGSAYEREHLDFKEQVNPTHLHELAKDIAALSNRTGGVILVGVEEKNERLDRYKPLPIDFAEKIRLGFNCAAKDHCVPNPPCDPRVIARDTGFVVAVNVHPIPDQLIGVKVTVQKQPGERISDRAYVFPVRVQTGTDFLTPERLPMMMLPEVRYGALRLDSIPQAERGRVRLYYMQDTSGHGVLDASLDRIDVIAARAIFVATDRHVIPHPVEVPLKAIEDVHRFPTGTWRVLVRGHLRHSGDNVMYWDPPSR